MSGPLAGLRVLDLTRVLAGPFATAILADLGAEVVKLEPPTGDDYRAIGPFRDGESALFALTNRGKRSVVVDLKAPEGQALARRMRAASTQAISGLELDMRRLLLHGAPGEATLTPNEVQFLAALVRAPGQRLERWQLQQCLDAHSNPALEMLIARLRKKLQPLCRQEHNPIQPLRGVGYQLCIDITLR